MSVSMRALGFFFVFLISLPVIAQQPWTQKKGEGYFQLGASYFAYADRINDQGEGEPLPRPVTQVIVAGYGEYGLSDEITAHLNIPIHFISNGPLAEPSTTDLPEGQIAGTGRIMTGITWKFLEDFGMIGSLRGEVYAPTLVEDAASGLISGFDSWGFQPTLALGSGWKTFFAAVESGVHFMTHGYSHRFVLKSQVGTSLGKKERFYLIGNFTIFSPFEEYTGSQLSDIDGNTVFSALYQHNQRFAVTGIKLGFKFKERWSTWWLLGGGVGAARNIGMSSVLSGSLGWNLKP